MQTKKKILDLYTKNGFILEKGILDVLILLDDDFYELFLDFLINSKIEEKFITKNMVIAKKNEIKSYLKKVRDINSFDSFFEKLNIEPINDIKILTKHTQNEKKINIDSFVDFFNNRFDKIKELIQHEYEMEFKSIRRVSGSDNNIIVMILDKKITKNNHIIFTIEDKTGLSKLIINSNNKDLYKKCENIVLDEVVLFNVDSKDGVMFAKDVFFLKTKNIHKKYTENDEYLVFVSDVHVGSKLFLEKNFINFIDWINGDYGNEYEKNISKNIKYVFFIGDNIDGINVFPNQDDLLDIKDIKKQYEKFSSLIGKIRNDVNIIVLPGQHDSSWIGEPQGKIDEIWAKDLHELKNVTAVPNPCLVEIKNNINILLYHGASFHSIAKSINSLDKKNPTNIMEKLLNIRYLSPIYGSSDYDITKDKDSLLVEKIPDIVASGDSHRAGLKSLNGIKLISSSCWQSKTPFEEKMGNDPDPCKVPILNLKTMDTEIMDFSKNE